MNPSALINWQPTLHLLLTGICIALGPLSWVSLRQRQTGFAQRWHALALLTAFLTLDLVVFGAYTRLSDSGLGCPDWPGCYGHVSPVGASASIHAAELVRPEGPVTHSKAWIEMIHRYLATMVGVLITVLMVSAWCSGGRRVDQGTGQTIPRGLATLAFVWVIVQGIFGGLTVTLKLYPLVVSGHLLLALSLLVILTWLAQASAVPRPWSLTEIEMRRVLRWVAWTAAALALQLALGAWVSTNYAVLACSDFPRCLGQWWPSMDFRQGYTLLRALGHTAQGDALDQGAYTAIHMGHRLGAVLALPSLLCLTVVLWRLARSVAPARRYAQYLLAATVCQLLSGLSNVVLGWPLAGALAHTAGAAVLCVILTLIWGHVRRAARAMDSAGRVAG